jgi:transposase
LRLWQSTGTWDRIHKKILKKLNAAKRLQHEVAIIDSTLTRAFGGGAKSGPNPTDRAKPGTKYTLMVDANGVPLAVRAVGANVHDVRELIKTVIEFPQVSGVVGRPLTHPKQVIADAGYDDNAGRRLLRWIGIEPKIRRRRTEHGSHLGRVRWVVERTISWFKGLRRLRFRYDRDASMVDAWAKLAAAVITFRVFDNL